MYLLFIHHGFIPSIVLLVSIYRSVYTAQLLYFMFIGQIKIKTTCISFHSFISLTVYMRCQVHSERHFPKGNFPSATGCNGGRARRLGQIWFMLRLEKFNIWEGSTWENTLWKLAFPLGKIPLRSWRFRLGKSIWESTSHLE